MAEVAVTGIGLVAPLGATAAEVVERIERGESAARPTPFGAAFDCPVFAPIEGFDAAGCFPNNKNLRLMNRDAQMAAVAARRALDDAKIVVGQTYPAEEIGLYGATGLSGLPVDEVRPLIQHAAASDGGLDLQAFGRVALRRIRPVLSFKILANMPICFASIFEGLRGPNAVYSPWEEHGTQAIAAAIRAVRSGEARCALAGGCDVKTHLLSFVTLQQLGAFEDWKRVGRGRIPAEGAAMLVLERRADAIRRSATILCTIEKCADVSPATHPLLCAVKSQLGDCFAAAAAVQTALACHLARTTGRAIASCHGFNSQPAAFLLEAA